MANYGDTLKVEDGLVAEFPDFTLKYKGNVSEPLNSEWIKTHPGGMKEIGARLFSVEFPGGSKELRYSGGFGLFGPLKFEVNGKNFVLEAVTGPKFSIKITSEA